MEERVEGRVLGAHGLLLDAAEAALDARRCEVEKLERELAFSADVSRSNRKELGDEREAHKKTFSTAWKTTPSPARLEYFQSARASEVRSARSPLCFQDLRKSGTDLSSQISSLLTMV